MVDHTLDRDAGAGQPAAGNPGQRCSGGLDAPARAATDAAGPCDAGTAWGTGAGVTRVFEIVTTPAIIEAKPEQIEIAPSIPVQESEPKTEDVAKMVAEEGMLLPVFFAVDSSNLTETDLDILNKNAEWLKKNADVKINVRGYADERGTDEYNVKLSERRAKAVMDYLIKQDVDANRLKFIGYGKELSTDKSEAGLARSRRVDFLVIR